MNTRTIHFYRNAILFIILTTLMVAVSGCSKEPTFTDIDYKTSPYKHINNGGITTDEIMPYNIDAITGATMTVEGPGVVTSIPLSIRELENRDEGMFRGVYKDIRGKYIYEGMDLYYLLNNMVDGDNGIILTDTAYRVQVKNCNRETISEFTLEDIKKAHDADRPIIIASGIGTLDEKTVAPFVFDAENKEEHSEGYIPELHNEDGCLKLVYDLGEYGENPNYSTYTNIAYVYVCEETEPGFKHTQATNDVYSSSKYTDYIVTFRGSALGKELDFTVRELEDLVSYNDDGSMIEGGIGYSDFYSLANTTYWYVNEYQGLDLYKLLIYLGMKSAEDMSLADARTTLVQFVASDGVLSKESFSVDTLSYPDAFGFYNKNAADMGDGSYKSTNADLVKTGYPVLLAYGVNNYPYTITKSDPGYLSGLSNSGGPMRVVFGKTQYNHANGSNQVQYLSDVIVGDDILYNTHKYTDDESLNKLSANEISVLVKKENGEVLTEKKLTVGEIEDIIYGAGVSKKDKKDVFVKDSYETENDGTYTTDIYEGLNLEYFLMNTLGLPGTNGTVTFAGNNEITVNLQDLFKTGFNSSLKRDNLKAILAFAKNGSPMVSAKDDDGYIDTIKLNNILDTEKSDYRVENFGGPVCVVLPDTSLEKADGVAVSNLKSITVELKPDAYAHINEPYNSLADRSILFCGEGLDKEVTYTVNDIESRQREVKTLDYSMLNGNNTMSERRYRGIAVYDLFKEIGIKNNAGDVTVYASDGSSSTYSLSLLKKQTFTNYVDLEKSQLSAMIAYGTGIIGSDSMDGLPLVVNDTDEGYEESYDNAGGPFMLIVPQEDSNSQNAKLCLKDVVKVEVAANDIDTWGHHMSDVYEEFLNYEFTFTVKNDDSEVSQVFTLEQLEEMKDIIARDKYEVLDIGECEGIDIWKFIQKYAGKVPGIDNPISITVYASDGYKNDLLSVFYKEGFVEGVPNSNGDRKKLILAYGVNGCPLVDSESHEGYTGIAGNTAGPLRVVAESNQGASVKQVNKLVVTVSGSGALDSYMNNQN